MRIGRFWLLAVALLAATLVTEGSLLAQYPGRSVTIKSKRYWADAAAGAIRRSNLDGSAIESVVAGLDAPYGLALDPIAGVLVWTNSGGDGAVQRWNPASGELATLSSAFDEPYAIVLDGKIRTAYAVVDGSVVKAIEDPTGESDATEIIVHGEPEPLPLDTRRSILEVDRFVEPDDDPVPTIHGLALDLASSVLYIADGYGMMARRVRLTDNQVDALIFEGGPVAVALPGATR